MNNEHIRHQTPMIQFEIKNMKIRKFQFFENYFHLLHKNQKFPNHSGITFLRNRDSYAI